MSPNSTLVTASVQTGACDEQKCTLAVGLEVWVYYLFKDPQVTWKKYSIELLKEIRQNCTEILYGREVAKNYEEPITVEEVTEVQGYRKLAQLIMQFFVQIIFIYSTLSSKQMC